MVFSKGNHALVVLVLAAMSSVANAQSGTFDGRFYEVVPAQGITWDAANAAAKLLTHGNVAGHLATINSPEEDAFVQSLNIPPGNKIQAWIGGFQLPISEMPQTCVQNPEPGCGWKWINDETIAPLNTTAPFNSLNPYTNWQQQPLQPDNSNGAMHLAIAGGVSGWNDQSKTSDIWAYIVEYGDSLVIPAPNCQPPGCNMTGGAFEGTFIFKLPAPPFVVPPTAEFTATSYLVLDPRFDADPDKNMCGKESLPLFPVLDESGFPVLDELGDPVHEVVLSATLCGNPDFVVTKLEGRGPAVQINRDFVEFTSSTNLPLPVPGTNNYVCQAPPLPDVDQTHREVVAYQGSQGPWLEEDAFNLKPPGVYNAALKSKVAELTYKCGSGTGKGAGRSLYFAGLRIVPPPDFEPHDWLVHYTLFKLDVLALGVQRAKLALSNGNFTSLMKQVMAIKADITKKNYVEALAHVKNLDKTNEPSIFGPSDTNNYGELQARIDNVAFMIGKLQAGQ